MSTNAKESEEKSKGSVLHDTKCYRESILLEQQPPPLPLLYTTQIVKDGVDQYEACDPGQEH